MSSHRHDPAERVNRRAVKSVKICKRRKLPAFRQAFTLIEVLFVVALIATLIAILLPSLAKARRQARTTLCAARLAGLSKAILLYSEENDDTPPFIGRGWEDLDDDDDVEWPPGSGVTLGQLKRWETWCTNRPDEVWFAREEDWPIDVGVEFGSLFQYTRFKDLYLCPEFQRISGEDKAQNAFNFTRTVLGRKWYVPDHDPEAEESGSFFGAAGAIMKTSEIHSPAKMWLLLDESYLRHCASPDNEFMISSHGLIRGGWMANDCMNFYLGDELGQYHGAPVLGLHASGEEVAVRRGHVGHYDGHVEPYRDVLPGRTTDLAIFEEPAIVDFLVDFMVDHLFAQRGITVDLPARAPIGDAAVGGASH